MLEEEEVAVAMASKYSSETCDVEESKKLATVEQLLLHYFIVIWKSTVQEAIL